MCDEPAPKVSFSLHQVGKIRKHEANTSTETGLDFQLILALGFLMFVVFIGTKNVRYQLLQRKSRTWPETLGTVQKGEAVFDGPFLSFYRGRIHKSLFGYTYKVGSIQYVDFFAVVRKENIQDASGLQEKLSGTQLTVRYDPEQPYRSFITDSEILGKTIYQNPEWIPPAIRFNKH